MVSIQKSPIPRFPTGPDIRGPTRLARNALLPLVGADMRLCGGENRKESGPSDYESGKANSITPPELGIERFVEGSRAYRQSSSSSKNLEQRYTSGWVSRIANNIPRPGEPVSRLNAVAAKRVLCTSEDSNALIYTAVNLHALDALEDTVWLLSDDEFHSRLTKLGEDGGRDDFKPGTSNPQALKAIAFRSAFTYMVFSSGSVNFLLDPDLRASTGTVTSDQELDALRDRVSKLNGSLQTFRSIRSGPHLPELAMCLDLISILLGASRYDLLIAVQIEQWVKAYGILYDESLQKADKFAPLPAFLLASAIQVFVENGPKIFPGGGLIWWGGLSTNQEYPKWSLDAVSGIIRTYRYRTAIARFASDKRPALELIESVLPTFHGNKLGRPSNITYIPLLRQARTFFESPRYSDWDLDGPFITIAIDIATAFIRLAQESDPDAQTITQMRDGLAHCLGIIASALAPSLDRYNPKMSFPTSWDPRRGFSEKLKAFLDLVFEDLKGRMDLFDEALSLQLLGLEIGLIRPEALGGNPNVLEEYQRVFLEIKSFVNELGYSGETYPRRMTARRHPFLPARSDNPQNPPAAPAEPVAVRTSSSAEGRSKGEAAATMIAPLDENGGPA
ncbi:hypothetical protein FS837_000190 [Tulasnella sp. UAMH 9824]|nr:hypothetical protein FS837_000190 [Tulasnella sp. UAMH 9824]